MLAKPLGYVEFACVVKENNVRCNRRHLEPYMTRQEKADIESSGFICEEHLERYAWSTRMTSHLDTTWGSFAEEILSDAPGARTNSFIESRSGKDAVLTDEQINAGKDQPQLFNDWEVVEYYPQYNDYLMVKKEAKPLQTYVILGLAQPKKKEEKDPFEEGFDV